jgi:hypothetical protein
MYTYDLEVKERNLLYTYESKKQEVKVTRE